jgi:hypothetical protein
MQVTWKIEQTDFRTSDGLIQTAHWRCTAQDGDYTASVYGSAGLGESEQPKIPYPQVTEAEVLDWVWENGVDKDETEANLASQIDALKNPVQESGVPWAEAVTVEVITEEPAE